MSIASSRSGTWLIWFRLICGALMTLSSVVSWAIAKPRHIRTRTIAMVMFAVFIVIGILNLLV